MLVGRMAPWLRAPALATALAFGACSSTTTFETRPTGAQVWINGMPAGTTPTSMTDSKIIGSSTQVHIEAPGYEPLDVTVSRDERLEPGALIAGIFLLVPLLWVMRYNPVHHYELRPIGASAQANSGFRAPAPAPAAPAPVAPAPAVAVPAPVPTALVAAPAPPASGSNRQARDAEARKECLAGRWQRGVEILADLYVETNDPVLLHNQARCFEQNGQYAQAASRFREYLRLARKTLSPADVSAIEASIRQNDKLAGR